MQKKTMENLRNRINVKLVINEKGYLKLTSRPSYMLPKMFDNNLVAKSLSLIHDTKCYLLEMLHFLVD